ncbi:MULTISPECIES: WD40 repeat domain-containing protein [Fischerella]|uniref:WD40 repeat domain-containing protein n=1 Tax=Fischerella TaxID=1190 RepID=UPI00035EF2AC|nr:MULTISPECIES: hypothetical protein [Fischerella]MBD2430400.1 hypothetical protein [Fischerella sp. FACHB-380]
MSASFDQTIKLWSISTGKCLQVFTGYQVSVTVAKFSTDSQYIVSGSTDHTLKVWNIVTGKCQQTLTGHSDLISTLLVTNNTPLTDVTPIKLVAFSGSFDESIKLWELQQNKCWQTLKVPCPYTGMKFKGMKGLSEAQWATLEALGANSEVG